MLDLALPVRPTLLTIDLDAVRHNARRLKDHAAGALLMAVIKANAYGLGAVPVAKALETAGADWFGVALVTEAVQLRSQGIEAPVLVLGPSNPEECPLILKHGITPALYSMAFLEALEAAAADRGVSAQVHLKVDSGMGRLGFRKEALPDLLAALRRSPHVKVDGIFSMLASADEPQARQNAGQIDAFNHILETLRKGGLDPSWTHMANSAASLALPGARFNLIRPGLALYGILPSGELPAIGLQPALRFQTVLAQVKDLPPGSAVGYSATYVTKERKRIGILPVGYADGLRRSLGGQKGHVLIQGKRCPILGRVSMDLTAVDLDPVPEAEEWETVTLWGGEGEEAITPADWASWSGTIPYEVTCSIGPRVARQYRYKGKNYMDWPLVSAEFMNGDAA